MRFNNFMKQLFNNMDTSRLLHSEWEIHICDMVDHRYMYLHIIIISNLLGVSTRQQQKQQQLTWTKVAFSLNLMFQAYIVRVYGCEKRKRRERLFEKSTFARRQTLNTYYPRLYYCNTLKVLSRFSLFFLFFYFFLPHRLVHADCHG